VLVTLAIATVLALIAPQSRGPRPLLLSDIDDITVLVRLEDTRRADEATLARILQSAHPEVRRRAAVAVGRIADQKLGPLPTPEPPKSDAEYRRLVERWVVPDYNGAPRPRAVWETPRGSVELELYPGDAPMGVDYFVRLVESGAIVGTEFGRVVPNFVAQQRAVRDDVTLRDEVNRHGLTRGNLSWASAGLDTGRPGYTLGSTPQPHNEGNFTALGRVVSGMDVVDRIELGDRITAARMR
jgi:peptidylprolyl isomerase